MVEVDDTLHGETIPAESLASDGAPDFDELQPVPRANYDMGREIARGGMGRIVAARDRRTGRPIVIKEVRADLMSRIDDSVNDALIRRFKREALLTARLQHPAVVPVYEIGRFDDTPFIAMKRVDGTPLLDLLAEAASLRERMALLPSIIAVAEAIAYAHSESVIHRDLKPANILVGSFGETVVIDWGLAKLLSESDELIDSLPPVPGDVETVAGAVFGTPAYMPPEQAAGDEVDPAADVYALGALLYHMLTGEAPYSEVGGRSSELIEAVRERPPRPIAELEPEAPTDLVSVVDKAMARDAGERYSAADLVAELRSFQAGQQVAAHDYTIGELIGRWVGRHRALVITAVILLVAGAGATSWFVFETVSARDRALEKEKLANERHRQAMERTFERGLGELERGNRRAAIASLAEAYPHLDDPRVARALAEALRGVRGFEGELARFELPVDAVRIRADGKRVAAMANSRVYLMTDTGERLGETDATTALFAGGHLVTFTDDQHIQVWSSETGEKVGERRMPGRFGGQVVAAGDVVFASLSGGAAAFTVDPLDQLFAIRRVMTSGLSVSADAQRFLVVAFETRVFDRSGAEVGRLPEPQPVSVGAIAPDGSEFVRAETGGLVRYRADGTRLGQGPGTAAQWVGYSRDGSALIYQNGGFRVCVWTIGKPKARCDLENGDPEVGYSTDLGTVAIGRRNGDVAIRDGATGRVRHVIAASEMDQPTLALTPDGERMVTGGEDGAVRLWDVRGDSFDAAIDYRGRRVAFAGALILLAGRRELEIWDPDSASKPLRRLEVDADAKPRVATSADNRTIAWAGATWDVASGARIAAIPDWDDLSSVRLDPKGDILVATTEGGQLIARSARTGELMWAFDPATAIEDAARRAIVIPRVGPRGELLLQAGGADLVIDIHTGALLHKLRRDDAAFGLGAAFLATGVVAAFDGARIYLDDLTTGKRERVLRSRGHTLIAHPDGVRLLIPLEQTMMLLDTRTGASRPLAFMGTDFPKSVAFSPDGTLLAIASFGGNIELFDVETLGWIGRRNAQPADMIAFSAGGRLLALGPGRIFIFDLPVETRPPGVVEAEVTRALGAQNPP